MTAPATALDRLDALERIRIALRNGPQLTRDDAEFLATAIGDYLENRDLSLSAAFGIEMDRGERDPRDALAIRRRDAALRRAAVLIVEKNCKQRISGLRARLARYFDGTWRQERTLTKNPHHRDKLKAALWDVLKASPQVPSYSTIWRAVEEFHEIGFS